MRFDKSVSVHRSDSLAPGGDPPGSKRRYEETANVQRKITDQRKKSEHDKPEQPAE